MLTKLYRLLRILAPLMPIVLFLIPQRAHAGWFGISINDMLASAVAYIVFITAWIISFIASFFIMFQAWVVQIILQLSETVVTSPPVVNGFEIVLAVTNLGFVLGIVIIAIMTIFRHQTYGMKKTLLKLVAAAFLVNFSLVIAGSILSFSNTFTTFFMKPIGGDPAGFAEKLAGSFTPQRFINFDGADLDGLQINGLAAASGASLASIINPFLALLFIVFALIMIVITLGVLAYMLILRYLILSFLLILMPFAWISWVFPRIESNWKKWWDTFLRWTFFAPIVVFFLYLSITAQSFMANTNDDSYSALTKFKFTSAAESGPLTSMSEFIGSFMGTLLGNFLQMLVVIGLTIGGIYAADKMGIKGAAAGMSAATAVGKSFQGYVGARTKQAATSLFRGEGAQKMASKLQKTGAGSTGLKRLISLPSRYLGRGMQATGAYGGERAVKAAEARVNKMTIDQQLNGLSTATAPQRIAMLKNIKEAGRLDEVDHAMLQDYVGDKREKEFSRYGQGKLYKELRTQTGLSAADIVKSEPFRDGEGRPIQETKLRESLGTMSSPGALPKVLFGKTDEELRKLATDGKPLPLGAKDIDDFRVIRAKIMKEMLRGGFSPQNMAAFMKDVAKGGQLDEVNNLIKELAGPGVGAQPGGLEGITLKRSEISAANRRWSIGNAAQDLGVQIAGPYDITWENIDQDNPKKRQAAGSVSSEPGKRNQPPSGGSASST